MELLWRHKNSIPSYLWEEEINLSLKSIFPSVVNAVTKERVVPLCSSVFNAIMTLSSEPGMNLNEENPRVRLGNMPVWRHIYKSDILSLI